MNKTPDHLQQKIVSYLSVYDLLKVRAASHQTQQWLLENCDKSLMREGHQNRLLKIKLSENLQPSHFILALTDIFHIDYKHCDVDTVTQFAL